jgi:hypothetical protein
MDTISEIRNNAGPIAYTGGFTPSLQSPAQQTEEGLPVGLHDRFDPQEQGKDDPGIYNPKMFKEANGQDPKTRDAQGAKETKETQKTKKMSEAQAAKEFEEVLHEAKEKYGQKEILIEHFDAIDKSQTSQEGGAQGKGGAQAGGGMPPHIQVAQSLMNETRFPPELQAKFKEKGQQLLDAWSQEQAGKGGAGNEPQEAAATADAKKAA